ncbi:TonB-dependent siderophore receptor [Pseudomonas turukhanskensis]|uniref:Ligand-gated channel n=1 Tax=Pseudomonas turukhanskensis TaxID=1806536 RepID=A0A9W6K8Q5_9PSED|nr:TonB-dependent siderophore receptor [Pseudomonas turukhanskensis]GLK89750.1 ligand-gated channel [Pseudomonas turukhanskensis]
MYNLQLSPLAAAVHKKTRALLSPTLLVLALGSSQLATAEPVALDIPAQSLVGALNALAQQADLQLLYSPDAIKNLRTQPLKGNLEPAQALNQLLQGSGLTYELNGNSVTLRPLNADDAAALSPANITGQALGATTEDSGSYTSNVATIGKGEHKLKDIPQSVTIVTRKAMDDQNLNTLNEVLERTTGITTYQSPSGGKYIYSRGFEVETFQYDGVAMDRRYYGVGSGFTSDTQIYDRVEILRGANGLLQGAGEASGAVNLVRKRPKAEPSLSIEASAGSWDNYRQSIDGSTPLTSDGSLRGRVVAAHEDREYFYDDANSTKNVLYAMLEYDITDSTVIAAGASVEDLHSKPFFGGLPRAKDGSALDISRSTYTGADWNKWNNKQTTYFSDITHDFNEDWRLKGAATYVRETNDMFYSWQRGAVDPATGTGGINRAYLYEFENTNKAADLNLTGKFRNLGREHEVVVGANASELRTDDLQGGNINPGGVVNIYDPVSPPEPSRDTMLSNPNYSAYSQAKITQSGIYGVVRYKLLDPLTMVVGARTSNYKYDYNLERIVTGVTFPSSSKETGEVSPYGGFIYELTPEWSAYISYADIFKPQTVVDVKGAPMKPILGSNYELGLKGELLDGRVNTSFAIFRVDQKNKAALLDDSCPNCYVAGGKARSLGLDAEISGEVITDLQLYAGYTYTHTENLNDPGDDPDLPSQAGNAYNSYTPMHMLRIWGDYRLPGEYNKFSVGAGGTVQSKTYNQNFGLGKIEQGGYSVWNGRIAYQFDKTYSIAVNANNVFDRRYYSSVGWLNASGVFGDPRNYTLTLKADF